MESNQPIFRLTIKLLWMVCRYVGVEDVFALMLSNKIHGHSLRAYFYECKASQFDSSVENRPGVNLLARNPLNLTALHCAILDGDKKLIKLLVGMRGDQLNVECSEGMSPLALAMTKDDHNTVQLLATHGAVDKNGHLLLKACLQGRYKMLRALLHSPEPNFVDTDGNNLTPLDLAIESGNHRTVQTLLTDTQIRASRCSWMPDATKPSRDTVILHAITVGNPKIVGELLSAGFCAQDVDLGMALKLGNKKVVTTLLATGIELHHAKWGSSTALVCAAEGGLEKAVRKLLPIANADEQRAALLSAAAYSHFHLFTLFEDITLEDRDDCDLTVYRDKKYKEESLSAARPRWKAEDEDLVQELSRLNRDMLKRSFHPHRPRRCQVHHVTAPFATM